MKLNPKIAGALSLAMVLMAASFGGFVVGTSTLIARAAACAVPYTFVNGTPADANQVNANYAAVIACISNIDNTNIGPAGIYASQIIPTNTAQATFGSSQQYTFPNGIIAKSSGAGLTTSATDDCGMGTAAAGFEFYFAGCLLAGDKIGNVGVQGNLYVNTGGIVQENSTANVLQGGLSLGGLGGPTFTGGSTNRVILGGMLATENDTSTNFGPVAPCFTQNGTACNQGTTHVARGTLTTTTSGSCVTGTICALASSGAVTLTAPAAFTAAADYSCHGNDVDNNALADLVPASGTGFLSDIINLTGGTISNGTAVSIQWVCYGF